MQVGLLHLAGMAGPGTSDFAASMAQSKVSHTFVETFVRGMLCNWLVSIAMAQVSLVLSCWLATVRKVFRYGMPLNIVANSTADNKLLLVGARCSFGVFIAVVCGSAAT